jgi:hypothetical protein
MPSEWKGRAAASPLKQSLPRSTANSSSTSKIYIQGAAAPRAGMFIWLAGMFIWLD